MCRVTQAIDFIKSDKPRARAYTTRNDMSPYSALLAPAIDLLKQAITLKVPRTEIPVLILLHAIRLSIGYQKATRGTTSWMQGMISVCALPMASGLTATVLTGSLPTFLQSDVVIPTYMATYLIIHNSALVRGMLNMIPTAIFDLVTVPADVILKSRVICATGVDNITNHYSASVKHNWFAPIFTGGSVGSAGFMLLNGLSLWSPSWTLNARHLNTVEWDMYGPYLLSFLYLALQGSNPQINTLVWSITQGVVGGKRARYFSREEARALIMMGHLAVEATRQLRVWSGRLPLSGSRSSRSILTESKQLGGNKKDI